MNSVDIIMVNWNAGNQLRDCLASVVTANLNGQYINKVIVVDNGSTDGSIEEINSIKLPLTIIRNRANRGFAAACNQGADKCTADFILFLNPDTILQGDSLQKPVDFLLRPKNSSIGIAGIQLVDEKNKISRSCVRFPEPSMFYSKMIGLDRLLPNLFPSYYMNEFPHDVSREVDHVIGAFYLVRRNVFQSLGGFDERFFVYLEDLDFSLRAKQAGWKCYYLTETQAYHKGGGTSEQVKATRLFYSLRSRILYGCKHFPRITATFLLLSTLLLEPIPRLVLGAVRCSVKEMSETFKAYSMLLKALPDIMKQVSRK